MAAVNAIGDRLSSIANEEIENLDASIPFVDRAQIVMLALMRIATALGRQIHADEPDLFDKAKVEARFAYILEQAFQPERVEQAKRLAATLRAKATW
jgi:hypothetical protein